jgi:hypothetical protein
MLAELAKRNIDGKKSIPGLIGRLGAPNYFSRLRGCLLGVDTKCRLRAWQIVVPHHFHFQRGKGPVLRKAGDSKRRIVAGLVPGSRMP